MARADLQGAGDGTRFQEKRCLEAEEYIKHCDQVQSTVQNNVLLALKTASITGELSLAGQALAATAVSGLAAAVRRSSQIVVINLADCMVGPPALGGLLDAVSCSQVRHLNLHGNNIGSQTTAKIGRLLAADPHIKVCLDPRAWDEGTDGGEFSDLTPNARLNLKWNNLGISVDSFAVFCNGISQNSHLEELDLRSNQLSPECAEHLGAALRANKGLKSLDIRWNNIQNEGAEALLRGIEDNTSLINLHIQGNCVHREVALAIEECLRNHATIGKCTADHEIKTNILLERIKVLEESRSKQLHEIKDRMSTHLSDAEKKLGAFTLENQQKQKRIEELENKVFVLEEERKTAVQRGSVLEDSLKERERTHKESQVMQQRFMDKLRQEIKEDEEEKKQKLKFFEEQMLKSQRSMEEAHETLETQKRENIQLKEEMARLKNRYETDYRLLEDTFENEKRAWKNRLDELTRLHEDQLQRTRTSAFEKQQNLEVTIAEIAEKQSGKLMGLSERCERFKQEKANLEEHISSLQNTIGQMQRENSNLIAQVAEPARKLTTLLDELSNEKILNQKLKQEKLEAVKNQEDMSKDLENLKGKVSAMKNSLEQAEKNYESETKAAKNKIKHLQNKIDEKNKKIESMKSEEKARNRFLQSAFTKYFDKYNSTNPPSSNSSEDSHEVH